MKKITVEELAELNGSTAYFCPEYGISSGFANYSGGLGVLAGDHIKTASDLGINIFGIGLMYKYGYFSQRISKSGFQKSKAIKILKNDEPLSILVEGKRHKIFNVDMPAGKLYYKVWIYDYKGTYILLMDTDIKENTNPVYRKITDRLYIGDRESRFLQEYLLGYCGSKLIRELGIISPVYHINEGHAAFALNERIETEMKSSNTDFYNALESLRSKNVFTTHTPVIHGNEEFSNKLIFKYFKEYCKRNGLEKNEFLQLGKYKTNSKVFSMTVLALKLSGINNAVSILHAKTANKMWNDVKTTAMQAGPEILPVTNGIHFPTWVSDEYKFMYNKHMGEGWLLDTNKSTWENIKKIDDSELEEVKRKNKQDFFNYFMEYCKKYTPKFITKAGLERSILNIQEYDKPFIGFARRFAEYKRADLIFHDIDRLGSVIEKYGFILLISGKAHPADIEGQSALKKVISSISKKELQSRVIFLEDYDMNTGKQLTSTCDLWLNTPLRPKEACGTSGMKSAINGGLNLSILDGWWAEAYTGGNGFAFGGDKEYNNIEYSYEQAEELYSKIEHALDIYSNHKAKWYSMVRESIISTGTSFSSVKMLQEYNKLYKKMQADLKSKVM